MNDYIKQSFQKFKQFFLQASTVQPPSSQYGYDEYNDVIMLTKPVIYITVKELIRTHTVQRVWLLCVFYLVPILSPVTAASGTRGSISSRTERPAEGTVIRPGTDTLGGDTIR